AQITGTTTTTGTITEQGPGALTLSSAANTFGGGANINGGTLIISSDGNLGAIPATPAVNVTINGGTLESITNDVVLNANRKISLTGNASITSFTAAKTLTVNGLVIGPHTLTLDGPGDLSFVGGINIVSATTRGLD